VSTEAAWLAERRRGIGASEIAAVFGLSPYQSPYQLWADKAGLADHVVEETEQMTAGKLLEPAIAEMVRRRTGWDVVLNGNRIHWSVEHPWLFATPDAFVDVQGRPRGVLELKAASAWASGWDEDRPPLHYRLQLAHQMVATGCRWGAVACFDGPSLSLRLWEVVWSEALAQRITADGARFWSLVTEARALVAAGKRESGRIKEIELALGPTSSDVKTIQRVHEATDGNEIDLTEQLDLLKAWAAHRVHARVIDKQADALKAQAIVLAGPSQQIVADGRRVAKRNKKGQWRLNSDFRTRAYALSNLRIQNDNP
jgi:putative phage-type endonuclease